MYTRKNNTIVYPIIVTFLIHEEKEDNELPLFCFIEILVILERNDGYVNFFCDIIINIS
jgi:hypothetical protein